nr:phosphohistidine phosphatase SixA [uncultured Pseudomonas sp.]
MRLWLLRHGEAEAHARSDAERALTAHGRHEVRQAAQQLMGRPLELILVSPYLRAQQTAAVVKDLLGFTGMLRTVPWLTPDSAPREVLLELEHYAVSELLLVTHQPLVGSLGGWLVHGHRQQPLAMATASLAALEGEMPAFGAMRLLALTHPRRD